MTKLFAALFAAVFALATSYSIASPITGLNAVYQSDEKKTDEEKKQDNKEEQKEDADKKQDNTQEQKEDSEKNSD